MVMRRTKRGGLVRAQREFDEPVSRALYQCAHLVADEAKGLIMAGSVSGKGHVPSAPGEPPNNDTQALFNGIHEDQPEPLRARATSNAPHAAPLEFGTSKMAARPYMTPAAHLKLDDMAQEMAKGAKAAARKMGG